ncbi:hypothetical protein [Rhodococcus sp. ACS1]|uniref:hypothetical protein n=1 Tax=Rhodococcus sp. ACS1 TaxID=2028570 RepID=UPI00117B2E61|nr:hypothetical protein [Rhodococcus sp. ACS1]
MVVIVGSVAPWFTAAAFFSVPGTQSVGKYTLALGGIAAVVLLIKAATPSRWPLVAAAVIGIVCLLTAVVALIKASSLIPAEDQQNGIVSIGWGLWMTLVGTVLLVVGCIVAEIVASGAILGTDVEPSQSAVDDVPIDWTDRATTPFFIVAIAFGGLVAIAVWLDLLFGVTLLP